MDINKYFLYLEKDLTNVNYKNLVLVLKFFDFTELQATDDLKALLDEKIHQFMDSSYAEAAVKEIIFNAFSSTESLLKKYIECLQVDNNTSDNISIRIKQIA